MDSKKVFLILLPILVFVLYSNITRRKANSTSSTSIPLSTLPVAKLNEIHKNRIVHNCEEFSYKGADPLETQRGCVLINMEPTSDPKAIHIDYRQFSEQELMDRLKAFFPDHSKAPIIILEGNGIIEEGLSNPGFNLVLR